MRLGAPLQGPRQPPIRSCPVAGVHCIGGLGGHTGQWRRKEFLLKL